MFPIPCTYYTYIGQLDSCSNVISYLRVSYQFYSCVKEFRHYNNRHLLSKKKKKYNLLNNIPHTCISHVLDDSSGFRSSGCIMIVLLFHDIVLRSSCLVRSLVRSHALTFNICFDLLWIK